MVIPDWLKEIAEGGRMIQSIKMAWVAIQSQPETKTLDDKPMVRRQNLVHSSTHTDVGVRF